MSADYNLSSYHHLLSLIDLLFNEVVNDNDSIDDTKTKKKKKQKSDWTELPQIC